MTNRRTPEQWQALIKQQSESELTVTAFCRKHKLAISCFYVLRHTFTFLLFISPSVTDCVVRLNSQWIIFRNPDVFFNPKIDSLI
ncbi:IS66 family insertion sequence element accessory protein TnpA [Parashewanella hymeniacidonis]|uniref:IS66 family insertion sequence element accessory protein TnpA n=1 Tax=Parashewanella hymeniacidonis TaxID=2807618 RepID=UPI003B84B340